MVDLTPDEVRHGRGRRPTGAMWSRHDLGRARRRYPGARSRSTGRLREPHRSCRADIGRRSTAKQTSDIRQSRAVRTPHNAQRKSGTSTPAVSVGCARMVPPIDCYPVRGLAAGVHHRCGSPLNPDRSPIFTSPTKSIATRRGEVDYRHFRSRLTTMRTSSLRLPSACSVHHEAAPAASVLPSGTTRTTMIILPTHEFPRRHSGPAVDRRQSFRGSSDRSCIPTFGPNRPDRVPQTKQPGSPSHARPVLETGTRMLRVPVSRFRPSAICTHGAARAELCYARRRSATGDRFQMRVRYVGRCCDHRGQRAPVRRCIPARGPTSPDCCRPMERFNAACDRVERTGPGHRGRKANAQRRVVHHRSRRHDRVLSGLLVRAAREAVDRGHLGVA